MDFSKYDKKDLNKSVGYTINIQHVPLATFPWRWQGEELLDLMKDYAEKFGYITVKDYCDLAEIPKDVREMAIYKTFMGSYWLPEELNRVRVRKRTGRPSFYLYLPNPRPEPGLFDGLMSVEIINKYIHEYNMESHIVKEDNTMATTTNKSYDYTATPEELELEKAIEEAREEAEKKILDIRIELAKTLEALRTEYQEKEAVKREERQAHAWKRKYDALLKEGFSVEQAWEMTMEYFKAD